MAVIRAGLLAAVSMTLLSVSGCGTYRAPGTANLVEGEYASFHNPHNFGYQGILLRYLNCERVHGLRDELILAPGLVVITFAGNNGLYVPPNPKDYVFDARPGQIYTFERNYQYRSDDWIIDIVDKSDGDVVKSWWSYAGYSRLSGSQPDEELCEQISIMNGGKG